MQDIWQWGIDCIQQIQQVQSPALTAFFRGITLTGNEVFFLALIPLLFWCIDRRLGVRLAVAFLLSAYVNEQLKVLFAHPRPFEFDAALKLHPATGYGFPSGHSQLAVTTWGFLAYHYRRRWLWGLAVVFTVLVGFSRVYLGVHFPTDVLAGWGIGAVLLVGYLMLENKAIRKVRNGNPHFRWILGVLIPLACLMCPPTASAAMATFLGAGAGLLLMARTANFCTDGGVRLRLGRFLCGWVGLALIYGGLRFAFPGRGEALYEPLRYVRYTLTGLWVTWLAPLVFIRLRLASVRKWASE